MEAIFIAFLRALVKQYPGLPWAALLTQLEQAGEGFAKLFEDWWNLKMDEPWPGLPPMDQEHGQGPPTSSHTDMP